MAGPTTSPVILSPAKVTELQELLLGRSESAGDDEDVAALVASHEALRAEVERLHASAPEPLWETRTFGYGPTDKSALTVRATLPVPSGTEVAIYRVDGER